MKKGIILLLFLGQYSILAQNNSAIGFSEVMFYPLETNGEFIELYNSSKDSSIDLERFHIIYSTSAADTIIKSNGENGSLLQPGSYAVIFENDYDLETGHYLGLVPDSALLLVIDNGKFGSSGMANKSNRTIYLLDDKGDTLDTYTYSANNNGGISDEKIDIEYSSSENNWGNSNSLHGSPGFRNSIALRDYDLELIMLQYSPKEIFVDDEIEFIIKVKNNGKKEASNFDIIFYIDLNYDSISQEEEIILFNNDSILQSGDSLILVSHKEINQSGLYNLLGNINFPMDEKVNNDSVSSTILIRPKPNEYADIVINEIMFKPINDEPEWIELFNRSDLPINLKDWRFADKSSKPKIIDSLYYIDKNEYLILSEDETISEYYNFSSRMIVLNLPSLNNGGDNLKLIDSLGRIIDSVSYDPDWGEGDASSLERIDPDKNGNAGINWKSSISRNHATPGNINSVTPKLNDIAIEDLVLINDYGIIGKNVKIEIKIKNAGLNIINSFVLALYHDHNFNGIPEADELIEELIKNKLNIGDSTIIEYDLVDFSEGENRYLVKAIIENDGYEENNEAGISVIGVRLNEIRNDLIINEIMYSPISPEREWIEIYNKSIKRVNLKNYQIADLTDTTLIIENEIFLNPNEYLVFAEDSSFMIINPDVDNFIITSLPNLNNTGDKIILLDSLNRVIDSLHYSKTWGGNNGSSLERKLSDRSSLDSSNWNSSKDINSSTPGKKNSITPFVNDLMISNINSLPRTPIIDDEIKIEITVKNIGINYAENFTTQISYAANGKVSILDEVIGGDLFSGDSLMILSSDSFILEGNVIVKAKLFYNEDEDTSNNSCELVLHPGAKMNSVVINEFMAEPNSQEAEWIELFNNSDRIFDISTWTVSDLGAATYPKQISDVPIIIEEGGYIIITNDSSKYMKQGNEEVVEVRFGTLGNSEDAILLYDFDMNLVDSLEYDKEWEIEKGRSLERLSKFIAASEKTNWLPSLSKNGSSPGLYNSILKTEPAEKNSIIINEIMYDPNSGNSEFIELYNRTEKRVDIGGWNLLDGNNRVYRISPTFMTIEPDSYFLFASDSSMLYNYENLINTAAFNTPQSGSFSFSNSGESLIIIDHWGNTIDSIYYYPEWHNKNILITKNKTLERISPMLGGNESSNWSSSVSKYGGTPGRLNSIFTENNLEASGLTFEPNPFSPDNDGYEDYSIINYSIPFNTAQIRIKIFDDKGRLVRTLVNNEASSQKGSIVFDGLNDIGYPLKIGMYIVYLESIDVQSGKSIALKDVIVVARKL